MVKRRTKREQELIEAVEDALSCLGTENGYFPTIGPPRTRRLQAALAAYDIVPQYGWRGRKGRA